MNKNGHKQDVRELMNRHLLRGIPGVVIVVSMAIALLSYLYGPGVWNQPSMKITGASFDLKIPETIQSDYFLFRLLFWAGDVQKSIFRDLENNLKRLGFPEEKLRLIKPIVEQYLQSHQSVTTPIKVESISEKLKLTVSEERILLAAIFNMRTFTKAGPGFLPSNVLLFKVGNVGKKDAEQMQLTITVIGRYMDSEIVSDNKINRREVDGSKIQIELDKLSPGGSISGRIWYDSWGYSGEQRKDKVVAVYKNGRTPVEFNESGLDGLIIK